MLTQLSKSRQAPRPQTSGRISRRKQSTYRLLHVKYSTAAGGGWEEEQNEQQIQAAKVPFRAEEKFYGLFVRAGGGGGGGGGGTVAFARKQARLVARTSHVPRFSLSTGGRTTLSLNFSIRALPTLQREVVSYRCIGGVAQANSAFHPSAIGKPSTSHRQ